MIRSFVYAQRRCVVANVGDEVRQISLRVMPTFPSVETMVECDADES